jgi:glucose-6-phosphate-specific signal transduction histidine kinase
VKQSSEQASEPSETQEPWFVREPRVATAAAALLFVGVFVLRLAVTDPSEVITALYVLPISLLTVTFGVRGGIVGSAVGLVLLTAWVMVADVDLSAFGWVTRAVPLVAMGLLLGVAWDRVRDAAELRREHELATLRHRQAVEINDTLIQGMASAKWAIEGGHTESGLATLEETMRIGQQLVSGLIREADLGPRHTAPPPA